MYVYVCMYVYTCIYVCMYTVCMENYSCLPIWTYRESDFDEHPEVKSKLEMIFWCIDQYIYKRDPCMLHT